VDLVSISELRNHVGEIVDRVERGETVMITRAGQPVAELRPVRKPRLATEQLLVRCRRLPAVNVSDFRSDIDALLDGHLW
jgi:prevent-host-death family protein